MTTSKTYVCGFNNKVYRLDDNNFPTGWLDISIPDQAGNKTILYDIMTSPTDELKVCAVGVYNQTLDGNTFNQGIVMSFDGGITWSKPGGNWELSLINNLSYTFREVWFVNDQIIWIVEQSGKIFKSIDGGITFNSAGILNYTGLPGTPVQNTNFYLPISFSAAIHAISNNVAVVGVSRTLNSGNIDLYVFKTIDGGVTWNPLNSNGGTVIHSSSDPVNNSLGVDGAITAIWISDNETSIILGTSIGQFLSTNSGNLFQETFDSFNINNNIQDSSQHITWFPSYGNPTIFKNVGGLGTVLTESNDGGQTWTTVRSNETDVIRAFNLYNLNEGYYCINDKVYYTSDSGLTGNDTGCPSIDAFIFNSIWTNFRDDNLNKCGYCPEGYYEDPSNVNNCIKNVTYPALKTGDTIIAKPGYNYLNYGWQGAFLLEDITSKTYPLDSDILSSSYGNVIDSNNNQLLIDTVFNSIGEPWRVPAGLYPALQLAPESTSSIYDPKTGGTTPLCPENSQPHNQQQGEGRLTRCGIFGWNSNIPCYKYFSWYGFQKCINFEITQTYIIGLAANNYIKVYIDDVLIYDQTNGINPYFIAWRLLPITITQGVHKIKILMKDEAPGGSVGFEIYNLDNSPLGSPRSIRNIQTTEDLENSLIFSTKDLIDEELIIFENYSCLGSDTLDFCNNPTCLKYENIDKTTCNCYKIINCENEEDFQFVTVPEEIIINENSIYIFEFDTTKCWKIELSTLCEDTDNDGILDVPIVIPFQENETCDECLKECYTLVSCNESCPDIEGVLLPKQDYGTNQLYVTHENGCKFYVKPYNKYLGYYSVTGFETIKNEINNNGNFIINVDSLIYNGVEYINTPFQLIIDNSNINPLLCSQLNCTISNINLGNTIDNIANFLNSIFQIFNLKLIAYPSSKNINCNSIVFNDERDVIVIEFEEGNTFNLELNYLYDSSSTILSVKDENLSYQTEERLDISTCSRKKECQITNLTLTPINEKCDIKDCNLTYRKPNPNDNLKIC